MKKERNEKPSATKGAKRQENAREQPEQRKAHTKERLHRGEKITHGWGFWAMLTAGGGILFFVLLLCGGEPVFLPLIGIAAGTIAYLLIDRLPQLTGWLASFGNDPNYFLYSEIKQANIAPESLTFCHVYEKMNRYFTIIDKEETKLWETDLLGVGVFGKGQVYRPLVAYQMLYRLTDFDEPKRWQWLANASDECLAQLCCALRDNGETALTQALWDYHRFRAGRIEPIRAYLNANRRYLQARMIAYVRAHIDDFYYSASPAANNCPKRRL